jgi:hypothetical protein
VYKGDFEGYSNSRCLGGTGVLRIQETKPINKQYLLEF